ncbi:hypothetical protein Rhopal_007353-T1 [Rhodotorula paludigena]|uniref:Uncharacterized protein n=1 Tax=Rhodotorula paludigena TaxID=86838 RepID=A0AAV5GYL2_9BASI|nr:hypothetical protein Rhopal_007353-T1 [Rhodotorula paludigena]
MTPPSFASSTRGAAPPDAPARPQPQHQERNADTHEAVDATSGNLGASSSWPVQHPTPEPCLLLAGRLRPAPSLDGKIFTAGYYVVLGDQPNVTMALPGVAERVVKSASSSSASSGAPSSVASGPRRSVSSSGGSSRKITPTTSMGYLLGQLAADSRIVNNREEMRVSAYDPEVDGLNGILDGARHLRVFLPVSSDASKQPRPAHAGVYVAIPLAGSTYVPSPDSKPPPELWLPRSGLESVVLWTKQEVDPTTSRWCMGVFAHQPQGGDLGESELNPRSHVRDLGFGSVTQPVPAPAFAASAALWSPRTTPASDFSTPSNVGPSRRGQQPYGQSASAGAGASTASRPSLVKSHDNLIQTSIALHQDFGLTGLAITGSAAGSNSSRLHRPLESSAPAPAAPTSGESGEAGGAGSMGPPPPRPSSRQAEPSHSVRSSASSATGSTVSNTRGAPTPLTMPSSGVSAMPNPFRPPASTARSTVSHVSSSMSSASQRAFEPEVVLYLRVRDNPESRDAVAAYSAMLQKCFARWSNMDVLTIEAAFAKKQAHRTTAFHLLVRVKNVIDDTLGGAKYDYAVDARNHMRTMSNYGDVFIGKKHPSGNLAVEPEAETNNLCLFFNCTWVTSSMPKIRADPAAPALVLQVDEQYGLSNDAAIAVTRYGLDVTAEVASSLSLWSRIEQCLPAFGYGRVEADTAMSEDDYPAEDSSPSMRADEWN